MDPCRNNANASPSINLYLLPLLPSSLTLLTGGCPGAPDPTCFFCADGEVPGRADALVPPHYNQTCRQLHLLAPFFLTADTCNALTATLPIHANFYCGCETIDPTNELLVDCDLCGDTGMQEPEWTVTVAKATDTDQAVTLTCTDVGFLAETATSADFCTSLQQDFYSTCCLGIRPTPVPTVTPALDATPTPGDVTPEPTVESGVATLMTHTLLWWSVWSHVGMMGL